MGGPMLKLGPELFDLLNANQRVGNLTPVIYGVPGLSSAEIASIEAQLGFQLPADFVYLFQHLRDPGRVFLPWSNFKKQSYDDSIRWVLQGIEFDIDHNKFWMDQVGETTSYVVRGARRCEERFWDVAEAPTNPRPQILSRRALSPRQPNIFDHANRHHL